MAWNLPKASGAFPVGCVDVLTKTGVDGTLFRMYYPTKAFTPSVDVCPLWLDSPEYGTGFAHFIKLNRLSGLVRWILSGIRVPVLWQGPLVKPESIDRLPVVLFSHGLGGNRTVYSYIPYEIASHGFIVASVEHHDSSASATFYMEESENSNSEKGKKIWLPYQRVTPATTEERELRNKQVHQRAEEVSQLMNSIELLNDGKLTNILSGYDLTVFKDQINTSVCGVVGHSFGGATTIVSLAKDERFKVGVAMDVWMFPIDREIYQSKIDKPLLFINSDAFQWKSNIAGIRKLDAEVTGTQAERLLTTLLGTVHQTQCDIAFLVRSPWLAKALGMRGPTDPHVANEINMKMLLAFLGKHLALPCGGEVAELVKENPNLVIMGSNLELDEGRVQESKEKLKKEIP